MAFIFGLLPVLLFLTCLFLLDSFKLVKVRLLLVSFGWGLLSAGLCFVLNSQLTENLNLSFSTLSRYVAPVIEEVTKSLLILLLVSRKQIGFMIDAAIYGFAIGAGFAQIENIFYITQPLANVDTTLAIVRGFGTAIMHGGTVAIFAMIFIEAVHRSNKILIVYAPGLMTAILLHSAFNHFIVNPLIQAILIITLLPLTFYFALSYTNRKMQHWLELEFMNEVELLRMIKSGQFTETKSGKFFAALRNHFSPDIIVDLYCFISLYLELSIKAKRNMLLKETGFEVILEPDTVDKLTELKQLRKNIGKSGEMALQPLIRISYRDLWKLNQLS